MYKNIALLALLLPFFEYGITKEARINELKEAQYKKALELRALGKIISEGDEYTHESLKVYHKLLENSVTRKKELLDKDDCSRKLNSEEIYQMLMKENEIMARDLFYALMGKEKFKHSILKETYDRDHAADPYAFNSAKFIEIRGRIEHYLMLLALEKYDICLQELLKINKELAGLEK